MWKAIAALALCLLTPVIARAEYFSNMRGGKGVEAQQASSKAFAGLAQTMTGLSTLELANGADAKTHLATAITTINEAAGESDECS